MLFIDIYRKKWQISVSKKVPQVDFFSKTSQFSTFLNDKKGQFVAQNRQVTRECFFNYGNTGCGVFKGVVQN